MSTPPFSATSPAEPTRASGFSARVRRGLVAALGHAHAPYAIVAASGALLLLSLNTGLAADDYVLLWQLKGAPGVDAFTRAPWDLFRFTTPATTAELQNHGILSWWADPQARLAFFRPLSALTHYLDYRLWPEQPWLMHLHSWAWSVVAMLGILALYRRLIAPGFLLGLSYYLYALDDARGWFVSWVAGRNTVIATAISVWVLVFYVRARQDRSRLALAASLMCLPVSLLAGEGSVAICAYLFAHALWLESGDTPVRRLLRLWPYALIVVAYRVVYVAAGYGAARSGLYVDPGSDPIGFALAFAERMPILVFAQFGGAWSELWSTLFVLPTLQMAIRLMAVGSVVLYAYLLAPQARTDRLTAFGLTGGILCLIPACAAFPADRLLNWTAIGIAPVMARIIDIHLGSSGPGLRAGLGRIIALVLVAMHVVVAPPLLGSRSRGGGGLREMLGRVEESVPSDESIRDRTIVYLNPPAVALAAYVPMMRGVTGAPAPRSQFWMAIGTGNVRVARLDPTTVRVSSNVGLLENPASGLLRSPRHPFTKGQTVRTDTFSIRVRELDAHGMPHVYDIRSIVDLDDPRFVYLKWAGSRYAPAKLPAVGEAVTLAAADYVEVLMGYPLALDGTHPAAINVP